MIWKQAYRHRNRNEFRFTSGKQGTMAGLHMSMVQPPIHEFLPLQTMRHGETQTINPTKFYLQTLILIKSGKVKHQLWIMFIYDIG